MRACLQDVGCQPVVARTWDELGDEVMESAKSLIDGQEWDAADFWAQKALHNDEWFAKWTERNKAWVCIGNGCQAIAYFRSPARNNGSPAFGSRHHTPECDFRTRTIATETDEPEDAAEVDAVYNDGTELTIRYDRPRKMSVTGVVEDEGGSVGPTGRSRRAYVLESSNPTNQQRTSGLTTQLKKLRNSENYPAPNFRITVPDRGRTSWRRTTSPVRGRNRTTHSSTGHRRGAPHGVLGSHCTPHPHTGRDPLLKPRTAQRRTHDRPAAAGRRKRMAWILHGPGRSNPTHRLAPHS